MPDRAILLSAGGTGGHLFPAEALAGELLHRGRRVIIVTDRRGAAFRSLGADVPVHCLRAATLKPGFWPKLRAVFDMGAGIAQALRLLLRDRPAAVVGFGGYPSFPAVFAAQLLRIPTVLHEQNAVMGRANAVLARFATAVAASFPRTQGYAGPAIVTGNPVRPAIAALRGAPYEVPGEELRLLVTGGSQAAAVFGDVVPAAAELLPPPARARLFVMHQARADAVAAVEKAYAAAGVRAEVKPFFDDMPRRLSACHLFIGRSGASSVAEAAAAGRPAIFVPHPGHADMQQKHNAEEMAARGGGWIVLQPDFTPAALAGRLKEFLDDPALLAAAAAAAASCFQDGAAARLADLAESHAGLV